MKLRQYQKSLIDDTRGSFTRGSKRPLVVLPCGGGKTVCFADMAHKHIEKNKKNLVWFLVHRQELVDQTIATFIEQKIPMKNILVGMVQTVTRHLDDYDRPTFIIFDEAHHAKAKTWYNIVNHFPDVPMTGLTATPLRADSKPLGDIFDDIIEGVDAEWLIANGYLCSYDYFAPPVTDMEFKLRGTDYDLDEFTACLLKSKIYANIEEYIDPNRKTIIYSPSIKFSKALCARIGATHFDGETPKKERKQIVADFKSGKIKLLSNVNLIGEGFDVPDCDCIMLLRPTQSLCLFIQQSMRCLRPGKDKKATIYDFVGNVYRHGLPTEKHEWSLTEKSKVRNESAEEDIIVRRCHECLRIYSGTNNICPYCGNDNGKTKTQIEETHKAELVKIEKIEKKKARQEVGMAKDFKALVAIGRKRGYKSPEYWARMIVSNRRKRI